MDTAKLLQIIGGLHVDVVSVQEAHSETAAALQQKITDLEDVINTLNKELSILRKSTPPVPTIKDDTDEG